MTMRIDSTLYTAEATADAGRDGSVRTPDGRIDLALAKPPGMGGRAGDAGTNPEQLFAAGYAACFHGALLYHARQDRIELAGSSVTAQVAIGTVESGGLALAVQLDVQLPGLDAQTAEQLTAAAHAACPYSRATRGNIEVQVEVTT